MDSHTQSIDPRVMETMPSPTGGKTLAILDFLSKHPEGVTSAQTARDLGYTANLVARILQTMAEVGFAVRRDDNKAYVLSGRFLDLARPQVDGKSLVLCANDALKELRDETGETVQLIIEANGKALVLEQILGEQAIQVCGRVGMKVPLYSCAPGKAILSCWSHDQRAEWYQGRGRHLKRFTAATLARREDLEAELRTAEKLGYAVDRAEGIEGIHCVAAPILDAYGFPVAAITMMAPSTRLPESSFAEAAEACLRARAKIEGQLRR